MDGFACAYVSPEYLARGARFPKRVQGETAILRDNMVHMSRVALEHSSRLQSFADRLIAFCVNAASRDKLHPSRDHPLKPAPDGIGKNSHASRTHGDLAHTRVSDRAHHPSVPFILCLHDFSCCGACLGGESL